MRNALDGRQTDIAGISRPQGECGGYNGKLLDYRESAATRDGGRHDYGEEGVKLDDGRFDGERQLAMVTLGFRWAIGSRYNQKDVVRDRCCTGTPIRVFRTRSPPNAGWTAWYARVGIERTFLRDCVLLCSVATSFPSFG